MKETEYLAQTADLLEALAKANSSNKDFLAVASFLRRLALVYDSAKQTKH